MDRLVQTAAVFIFFAHAFPRMEVNYFFTAYIGPYHIYSAIRQGFPLLRMTTNK